MADQQTASTCTGDVLTARVHQIGIEYQNIARTAGNLYGLGHLMDVT